MQFHYKYNNVDDCFEPAIKPVTLARPLPEIAWNQIYAFFLSDHSALEALYCIMLFVILPRSI